MTDTPVRRHTWPGRSRRGVALLGAAAAAMAVWGATGLVATSQAATLTTVLASADSYVQSDLPSTNFGTAALVGVRAASGTKPSQTAYLRFTVSGLAAAPTSVQLQLYGYSTSTTGVSVRTAASSWSETGITATTAPTPSSAAVATMAPLTANTWAAADVSSVITGNGTYTLVLTTTSSVAKQFATREAISFEPRLVISTTGTPGATGGGTSSSFTATADAHVQSDLPTTNLGTKYVLAAAAPTATTPTITTYLRFSVAGLTGTVTSAQLRLYSYSTSSQGLSARTSPGGWTETGITFANAPTPSSVLSTAPVTLNTWATLDVTSAVTGNGEVNLAVTTTRTSKNQFASRESTQSAPQLVVTTGGGATTSTTTPPPNGSPVIVAGGDIACTAPGTPTATKCQQLATSDLALAQNPDAVLPLGDNQYEIGELSNFQAIYDPAWGRMKAISRPVPGNHEWGYTGTGVTPTNAEGYFTYFGDRSHPLQPGCTSDCKSWYSWDIGDWHLIALDSQCAEIGGCNPGSPQYQWLVNDLNSTTKSCVLAYWHIPLWASSTDREPAMFETMKLLYAKNADVVLSSHAHYYERFGPQRPEYDSVNRKFIGVADQARGIRQFVVGTGGKSFFTFGTVQANSEARISNTFGVLKMTLNPGGYSWNFVPANAGGSTDSGSDTCH